MFQKLGSLVSRWWAAFLLGWAAVIGLAFWAAPPWAEVAQDGEFGFLPPDNPSRRGEELFKKAFPSQYHPSSLVLVVHREESPLSSADLNFVEKDLQPGLEQIEKEEGGPARPGKSDSPGKTSKEKPIIADIQSFNSPRIGPLLLSEDRKATLVIVGLTTELLEHRNWSTLGKIDALLARLREEGKVPAGLEISQTGSAAIGRDVTRGQRESARRTEITTVVVVVVLLLLIYRAPVLAVIPLLTVFVAVELALKMLALLAAAELITVFEGMQIFLRVILYGTGVDYCLFLMARYREELTAGAAPGPGLATAVGKVGAALTAASLTVTLGIGMMAFAQFGQFHHAGLAIAYSLFLGLCAVLTLAAPLLRLAGRWAFWPVPLAPKGGSESAIPQSRFRTLSRLATLGISWQRLAGALQRRPVAIWLGAVVLMAPFAVLAVVNAENLEFDLVKRLPADSPSIAGIQDIKKHFPQGITGPVIVLVRRQGINFQQNQGYDLIATLTDQLNQQRSELGLADIRSLTRPLGVTLAAQDALDDLLIRRQLNQKPAGENMFDKSVDHYVGGTDVTQIQLVLNRNPLSRSALNDLTRLKKAIRDNLPYELRDADLEFLGLTQSVQDLRSVTDNDQVRIETLVVACVFVILVVLLRRPVVSCYLVASVLLSFFTTLGVTFAVFSRLDPAGFTGLDWKVPIFLFTILVAIGEDYNIFLMTRIHEEQKGNGQVEGIGAALVKTGGIITSCGIIMAGTFAALLPAPLTDLKQLGFALVLGVLLDTFVVRPILVPTFMIWLHGGKFFGLRNLMGRLRRNAAL